MAAKYWLKDGKIVVDGSGHPIRCETCPCVGAVPACCVAGDLPSTGTLTYTIGALAPATMNVTKTGNSYNGEKECDVGDGHTVVLIDYSSNCFNPGAGWSISFGVSVYVDGVLSNYVLWQPSSFAVGSSSSSFSVNCSPYHLHYEGLNTSGNDADGATLGCGGVTYSFTSAGGVINVVLDLVTP